MKHILFLSVLFFLIGGFASAKAQALAPSTVPAETNQAPDVVAPEPKGYVVHMDLKLNAPDANAAEIQRLKASLRKAQRARDTYQLGWNVAQQNLDAVLDYQGQVAKIDQLKTAIASGLTKNAEMALARNALEAQLADKDKKLSTRTKKIEELNESNALVALWAAVCTLVITIFIGFVFLKTMRSVILKKDEVIAQKNEAIAQWQFELNIALNLLKANNIPFIVPKEEKLDDQDGDPEKPTAT